MGKILFSVIIPTYNRVFFLKIAILSVLKQSFKNYELIIIDDGSEDNTREMVENFKKNNGEKINYFYQTHKGVSSARNLGIKKAKGNFICFLDSDDRFCQEKLEIAYEYIKKYPEYKIFHTNEIWYNKGKILSQKSYHQKPTGYIFEKAVKICSISISTAIISHEIFKEVGLFDENLPACEDYDFWIRATLKYPVFLIPEYLTIKEGGHADQQSKKYEAMDKFRIYALKKLLEENKNLSPSAYKTAYNVLKNKCLIYIKGAKKRGKIEEIIYYENLIKNLKRDE